MSAEFATLAAGCFWCVESVFQKLNGVISVESGYAGGNTENPTYESVCSGRTGHAEVIRIEYDPSVISFEQLLQVFFHLHDPTTLNQQGADKGTQYRSAIFFHNQSQAEIAEKVREEIAEQDLWPDSIVTEITPLTNYFSAEEYHQNYFNRNPSQGYCLATIPPKLKKLEKLFPELLKS